jgi:hypothetical protein
VLQQSTQVLKGLGTAALGKHLRQYFEFRYILVKFRNDPEREDKVPLCLVDMSQA